MPIRADLMPLRNEKGTIVGGLVTFQDMTLAHHLDQVIRQRYTFQEHGRQGPEHAAKFSTRLRVVAGTDATVLIEGDTGTGKDLLAKVIHSASRRADRPFVKVNCAALPDNLLESEMFGYVKGAFTGADRDKPGRFQEADGGTFLLDEIGDLPLALQAKLLRVIEDREFYPLGSLHTCKVDVRILSASNRGLEQLVEKGLFRQDLYYRLNVLRIELPPLRQRRGDLPLLIAPHHPQALCGAGLQAAENIRKSHGVPSQLRLPRQRQGTGEHPRTCPDHQPVRNDPARSPPRLPPAGGRRRFGSPPIFRRRHAFCGQGRAGADPAGTRCLQLASGKDRPCPRHGPNDPVAQDATLGAVAARSTAGRGSRQKGVARGWYR